MSCSPSSVQRPTDSSQELARHLPVAEPRLEVAEPPREPRADAGVGDRPRLQAPRAFRDELAQVGVARAEQARIGGHEQVGEEALDLLAHVGLGAGAVARLRELLVRRLEQRVGAGQVVGAPLRLEVQREDHEEGRRGEPDRRRRRGVPDDPLLRPARERGPAREDGLVAQEAPQVVAQLGGGGVAALGPLLERLRADQRQLERHAGAQGARVGRVVAQDVLHDRAHVVAREGALEGQALVERDAQAEHVARGAHGPVLRGDLLRARVEVRADELAGARERGDVGQLRQPEVRQLRRAVGLDQDVLRLDVAVHDARLVGDVQRVGEPREALRRAAVVAGGHRPGAAQLLDLAAQRAPAADQLLGDETPSPGFPGAVERDGVGVAQPPGGQDLAPPAVRSRGLSPLSSGWSLSATRRSSATSTASQTSPMPPRPSRRTHVKPGTLGGEIASRGAARATRDCTSCSARSSSASVGCPAQSASSSARPPRDGAAGTRRRGSPRRRAGGGDSAAAGRETSPGLGGPIWSRAASSGARDSPERKRPSRGRRRARARTRRLLAAAGSIASSSAASSFESPSSWRRVRISRSAGGKTLDRRLHAEDQLGAPRRLRRRRGRGGEPFRQRVAAGPVATGPAPRAARRACRSPRGAGAPRPGTGG